LLLKAYGMRRSAVHTPLIATLVKQGALYYCIILGVVILMTIATVTPKIYLPLMDANIVVPIRSVISNRLVLSLREKWCSNKVNDQGLPITPTTLASTQGTFDTTRPPTQKRTAFQLHSQTYARSVYPIYGGPEDSSISMQRSDECSQPSSNLVTLIRPPSCEGGNSLDSYMMSPISLAGAR